MDGQRLDDLARVLADGASRRQALKLLAGGAIAALAGSVRSEQATAERNDKPKGRPPKPCRKPGDFPEPGQICDGGTCVCPPGQTICPGEGCVDLLTSRDSCGSCENLCPGNQECFGGVCACPEGQDACAGGRSRSASTCVCECDPVACPIGMVQNSETCACECIPISCPTGRQQNPATCACECAPIACPDGQSPNPDTCQCEATMCGNGGSAPWACAPCQPGNDILCGQGGDGLQRACCNGQCVVIGTGTDYCAGCHGCPVGMECYGDHDRASVGGFACCNVDAGETTCGTYCLPATTASGFLWTDWDPNNCGGCGIMCSASQTCWNGRCCENEPWTCS
jgi:hypothetical protein